jgi:hypothetical protein
MSGCDTLYSIRALALNLCSSARRRCVARLRQCLMLKENPPCKRRNEILGRGIGAHSPPPPPLTLRPLLPPLPGRRLRILSCLRNECAPARDIGIVRCSCGADTAVASSQAVACNKVQPARPVPLHCCSPFARHIHIHITRILLHVVPGDVGNRTT